MNIRNYIFMQFKIGINFIEKKTFYMGLVPARLV